jgi:LPXTG-motif cell wall-anchored protein
VTTRERARAQKNIARALTAASVNRGDSSDGSLALLVGGSLVMTLGYLLRRRRQA